MRLFNKHKKEESSQLDFYEVDSNEKAIELTKQGILVPLHLMPLRFNGEDSLHNILYVPSIVFELKNRYDDQVEELLRVGKINGYQ